MSAVGLMILLVYLVLIAGVLAFFRGASIASSDDDELTDAEVQAISDAENTDWMSGSAGRGAGTATDAGLLARMRAEREEVRCVPCPHCGEGHELFATSTGDCKAWQAMERQEDATLRLFASAARPRRGRA